MRHDPSFTVTPPATLGEVIERLNANVELGDQARRDMVSAVNILAKLQQLPPSSIPIDIFELRKFLEVVQPRRFKMSAQRQSSIRSLVVKALIHAGVDIEPLRLNAKLSPLWADLTGKLPSINDRNALTRFSQWCSLRRIEPTDVDDRVVAAYREAITHRSFVKNAERTVQVLTHKWNRCADSVVGWPQTKITVVRRQEILLLPEETFPDSFADDLNAWCHRLAGTDPLDEQEFRPLRPVSVAWHRKHILRSASALVRQGVDPSAVVDLAELVKIENAKLILRWFLARNEDNQPSVQTHHLSGILLSIARHWTKLDGEPLRKLEAVCSRCRVKSVGMTKKNRDTVRLFDDERLVRDLLALPNRLMRRALGKRELSKPDAYSAALAVAIAILLNAPIRIENLVNVDLEKNIIRRGEERSARVSLYFPAHTVKNDLEIELPLAPETVRLIDTYLKTAWPVMAEAGCRDLFPGQSGTKRNKVGLGMAISRTTERELGVRISAHQFRHVTGYLYLKACPGDYETVRVLLGHKALQTTVHFYAGMEISAAAKRYDEVVLSKRRRRRGAAT